MVSAAEKLDEPVVSGKGDIEIKSTLEKEKKTTPGKEQAIAEKRKATPDKEQAISEKRKATPEKEIKTSAMEEKAELEKEKDSK